MIKIPKFKRDKYIFISNLKDVTANPDYPITMRRDGYLLSSQYTNRSLEALAKLVKARRNLLVSDNGNFTRMKSITSRFSLRGEAILALAIEEVKKDDKVKHETLEQRVDLILEVEKACAQELAEMDFEAIIRKQLSINPDYMIAMEDLTIPVMMMLGLMHPVFEPSANNVSKHQNNSIELYKTQSSGKMGSADGLSEVAKFHVLHAYDYASAFQGAKEIRKKLSPEGIAISYGGPMKSRRWVTSLKFGDKVETFKEKLPEPYLAATALTLGAAKGLESGVPVHILGVGTPILIAMISTLLPESSAISIDSTAPFKDANVGTLYGSKSAFIKMDQYKVAAYSLINNSPFTSRTPFFKQFEHDFPSNWDALRAELGVTTNSKIKDIASILKKETELTEKYIPFFSKMRSGKDEMMKRLRMDRAGHNFWILRNICVSVRDRMDDNDDLNKWIEYQVSRYCSVANRKWAEAVKHCFELSKKY